MLYSYGKFSISKPIVIGVDNSCVKKIYDLNVYVALQEYFSGKWKVYKSFISIIFGHGMINGFVV